MSSSHTSVLLYYLSIRALDAGEASYTRYLRGPLSKKGLYFGFPYPDFRTRAQKLGTRRVPRATSFSEKRTPASENRTLPMAASCSCSAGLIEDFGIIASWNTDMAHAGLASASS